MQADLRIEGTELIKAVARGIIGFQAEGDLDHLLDQLEKAVVNIDPATGNIASFVIDGNCGTFEPSFSLDVEARVKDNVGNALHGILYLDAGRNLLALEVFAWDQWEDKIDFGSLTPAAYSESGVSEPN